MSQFIDTHFHEKIKTKVEDSVCFKSVRLMVNLFINILIFLIVFICLLYSCNTVVTLFDLHIIFCVLGGTLIISQYNSWSMFIKRRYRKHIHWALQITAAVLVTAGTTIIIHQKSTHFNSVHGKLGLAALICCLASMLNGVLAMNAHKLCYCKGILWAKFLHYITGIASMFLATGSLCAALQYPSFKTWTGQGDVFVPLLTIFIWLFTILVSLDFWIVTANKIHNML